MSCFLMRVEIPSTGRFYTVVIFLFYFACRRHQKVVQIFWFIPGFCPRNGGSVQGLLKGLVIKSTEYRPGKKCVDPVHNAAVSGSRRRMVASRGFVQFRKHQNIKPKEILKYENDKIQNACQTSHFPLPNFANTLPSRAIPLRMFSSLALPKLMRISWSGLARDGSSA